MCDGAFLQWRRALSPVVLHEAEIDCSCLGHSARGLRVRYICFCYKGTTTATGRPLEMTSRLDWGLEDRVDRGRCNSVVARVAGS